MKKLKGCCSCEICEGSGQMTPELVSAIEHHLNSLILVKKNETTGTYVTFLNVEKQKVSINREFLRNNGVHFYETIRRIHDVFPDDSSLLPHENPSPHNTHVNYHGTTYNLKNIFENVMKRDERTETITEQTCSRSGRLLFRVYLVRVLSHSVVAAYKEKMIMELQKEVISSFEKDKKVKKKPIQRKVVEFSEEEEEEEAVVEEEVEDVVEEVEEVEEQVEEVEEKRVEIVEKLQEKLDRPKKAKKKPREVPLDPWSGSNVFRGRLKENNPVGFEVSKRGDYSSPFALPKLL